MHRPRRSTAVAFAGQYEEGSSAVSYGPSHSQDDLPLRWQQAEPDSEEENEEEEQEAEGPEPPPKKARVITLGQEAAAARRGAVAAAVAAASDPERPRQTAAQQQEELLKWMQQERNSNTTATYTSGWKQFVQWIHTVANPQRLVGEEINEEQPAEADVAAYLRFIVTVKGGTMTSAAAARAAIADHLRPRISPTYNPCQGRLIELMTQVLTPKAKQSGQKREMDTVLMDQIMAVLEREAGMRATEGARGSIWRDRTMIMLGYFCFLRTSEVARMVREDVSFEWRRHEGREIRVMKVHVNRMCKNDKERKGHTRYVQGRDPTQKGPEIRQCMVRSMEEYMEMTQKGAKGADPLFPKQTGGHMTADGPRGRLKYWLGELRVPDAGEYGFHSLRAGAATAAAQAGVPERMIKLAGNWQSDNGVRPYIRPQLADQMQASDALGVKRKMMANGRGFHSS